MDRQIPEDIEYKASISNMKAFGLAIKDEVPAIKSFAIHALQWVGSAVAVVTFVLGPFVPIVCLVGGLLYVIGNLLWQVIKFYISKGHALDAKSAIPEMDIENPLGEESTAFIPIVVLTMFIGMLNALSWIDVLFP